MMIFLFNFKIILYVLNFQLLNDLLKRIVMFDHLTEFYYQQYVEFKYKLRKVRPEVS